MKIVTIQRPRKPRRKVVRIAVMGVTGAGKSTFIRTVSGDSSIKIGESLASGTVNVAAYEFVLDDIRYVLVDTPGFDDDKQSDGEILKRISDFLSAEHEAGNLLSGIIYLHPINRPRVQGSTMVQIRVFKEFCGSDSYHNVVLGTTFWETIDESEATPREHELFSTPGFLGDIKDLGATTARVRKDRQSCIELVQSFADNEPVALKIQKDMAAGAGGFNSSDAAVALAPEIHQLRLDHDRELEEERRKAQEEEARRAQQEAEEEARRRQIERDREEARQRERERVEREEREYQAWLWRQRQKEKEEEERKAEERRLEAARQARLQLAREAEAAKRAAELEREREAERRRQQAREEERRKQEQQEAERRKAALCSFTRKPMYPHSGGFFRTFRRCPGPIGYNCGLDCSGDSRFWECDRCQMPCCSDCYSDYSCPIYHREGCFYKDL